MNDKPPILSLEQPYSAYKSYLQLLTLITINELSI